MGLGLIGSKQGLGLIGLKQGVGLMDLELPTCNFLRF